MAERHPRSYLDSRRRSIGYRDADRRRLDYREIHFPEWHESALRDQGRRCMDCGVPTCMGGCPIANLIPEWNDLVSRGRWRDALERLHATNNFPEFTGYTCPAPCEPACVLALDDAAVTIKSLERAIVDRGWESGWIVPQPPPGRTGRRVAIVGSGPAGLAAAQQLNRAGHRVVVFEQDDVPGGLMTYGIPDFKFAKYRVARRIRQLVAEGIHFRTGLQVGQHPDLEELRRRFDAVCLTLGALAPRELALPGRDLAGVELALPYLVHENRRQAGAAAEPALLANGRRVVVLGGGDTGADCVATANRQGAASVTQVDINLLRPRLRPPDNPWPEPPVSYQSSYARQEGCIDEYGFEALGFEAAAGGAQVAAVLGQRVSWTYSGRRRRLEKTVRGGPVRLPADLVLIAAGFSGPELAPFAGALGTGDGPLATDAGMQTALPGVFAAGDARMGQSLVVWAIGEGRDVARAVDGYLMGESRLPPGIRTPNAAIEQRLGS